MRERVGHASAWITVVLIGAAVLILLTGGLTLRVGGRLLLLRSAARPADAAAVAAALAWALLTPAGVRALARRWCPDATRVARAAAVVFSAAVFVVATAWNTRAVGGSDSSCYVLQAEALAHGHATLDHPLAGSLPDTSPAVYAPAGFLPSPIEPLRAVPICSAGLAILMAPFVPFGPAVFLVVPVCAALGVWLVFVLGCRLDTPVTGVCAAVLVATLPIWLYQAVQPMSDVPSATFWLAGLVALARRDARGAALGGLCVSIAVLMRINLLVPSAALVFLLPDWRAWLRFVAAGLPAAVVLVALNVVRYGGVMASGYGPTGTLFSTAHILPNAWRYAGWTLATASPLPLLGLASPFALRDRTARAIGAVTLAAAALLVGTYLAYTVFDDWWYTRFLLPVVLPLVVMGVAVGRRLLGSSRGWSVACLFIGVTLATWQIRVAQARQVFGLQRLESRFARAGRFAAGLPPDRVVLAADETGAIRYYGRRPTLGWDAIAPDALDRTLDRLRANGWHPVLVVEAAERDLFRTRFAGSAVGALDWPSLAEVDGPVAVSFYDPDGRAAYRRGDRLETRHIR